MLHASRKVHSDSRDVAVLVHFDLACVHASADGHTDSCERVEQLHTALHGLRRQVEDCQQAVAGALDQPAAVRLDQLTGDAVVALEQLTPTVVADGRRGARRVHDVGEQHRRENWSRPNQRITDSLPDWLGRNQSTIRSGLEGQSSAISVKRPRRSTRSGSSSEDLDA